MAVPPPTYGYAATLRGHVLVKTVSECACGAMVNALALEFDLWANEDTPDEEVRRMWLETVDKLPQYGLVQVEVRQYGPPVDPVECAMRAGYGEES